MPANPTYDQLLALVTEVAGMTIDGDAVYVCLGCNHVSETSLKKCGNCGSTAVAYEEEYCASGNDDEIDALYSLVHSARDLLGHDDPKGRP